MDKSDYDMLKQNLMVMNQLLERIAKALENPTPAYDTTDGALRVVISK